MNTILKASKIKYIKNVTDKNVNGLVYMQHTVGSQIFSLTFSKRQHQQINVGDQIVLFQKGKLTHIVEVEDNEVNKTKTNSKYSYTMNVRTVAILPMGLEKSDSSIYEANFDKLRRTTNLVLIDEVGDIRGRIYKIFKNNGNVI